MIGTQASKSELPAPPGSNRQAGAEAFRRYCSNEGWTPSVNLYEDDDGCHVVVDLAGVAGERIGLSVVEGSLLIRGDRAIPRPIEADSMACLRLMEIDHGPFCRAVQLPSAVKAEAITAVYRGGMLWVHLPKKKKGKRR